MEEIYLCVIPALSERGRLCAADSAFHHYHHRADVRFVERLDKWKKAGRVYQEFFEVSLKFGPCSKIGVKATFAIVEFLDALSTKLKLTVADESNVEEYLGKSDSNLALRTDESESALEGLEKDIVNCLKHADQEVLCEFVVLYASRNVDNMVKKLETVLFNQTTRTGTTEDIFGRNKYHKVGAFIVFADQDLALTG